MHLVSVQRRPTWALTPESITASENETFIAADSQERCLWCQLRSQGWDRNIPLCDEVKWPVTKIKHHGNSMLSGWTLFLLSRVSRGEFFRVAGPSTFTHVHHVWTCTLSLTLPNPKLKGKCCSYMCDSLQSILSSRATKCLINLWNIQLMEHSTRCNSQAFFALWTFTYICNSFLK